MKYNNRLSLRDLFMNPRLANVFPQFEETGAKAGKQTAERIQAYLVGALGGVVTAKGEITVKGKTKTVLSRVRQLQPLIERLFDAMPNVTANLRTNAKLYTPFISVSALAGVKRFDKKLAAMQTVLDNLAYNPDFQSSSPASVPSADYLRRREEWKKRVGYKEKP